MSNEPIHNDYDATDDIFAVEFIVIYLWWSVCVCVWERQWWADLCWFIQTVKVIAWFVILEYFPLGYACDSEIVLFSWFHTLQLPLPLL